MAILVVRAETGVCGILLVMQVTLAHIGARPERKTRSRGLFVAISNDALELRGVVLRRSGAKWRCLTGSAGSGAERRLSF